MLPRLLFQHYRNRNFFNIQFSVIFCIPVCKNPFCVFCKKSKTFVTWYTLSITFSSIYLSIFFNFMCLSLKYYKKYNKNRPSN